MEILQQPNPKMLILLGEPPIIENQDYRFMTYCLIVDHENGKLIYNGLTRCLIYLDNSELDHIGDFRRYEFLYKSYFLVSENFNEKQIVDELRAKMQKPIDAVYLERPSSFTILTTTKCNARCFYCYELSSKNKKHMSEETALKVAKYIGDVSDRSKTIHLGWFGGEPLFNTKVIDIITQYLRDIGQNFNSSFTSNGYLFDKDLVLKAKNIWNTTQVQITLDGTESVYNKTKNYIYKNTNPYKKVLNNIAMLLNNNISINIRLNLDFYNSDNLKELIKELYERFGNHPGLYIYAWPIFEDDNYQRTKEEHIQVFKELKDLEYVMESYGYHSGVYPKSELPCAQCMADDGVSVTISPNGDLGTCEHFIDSYFWGHIDNPLQKNYEYLDMWRLYESPLDICENCPLYPSCVRPSMCKEMSKCDEQYKDWRIAKTIRGIVQFRKNMKERLSYQPTKLNENVI